MANKPDFDLSEDEFAVDFAKFHPDVRWVQLWGKWLRWDGQVWLEAERLFWTKPDLLDRPCA